MLRNALMALALTAIAGAAAAEVGPGSTAPEFSAKDLAGKTVKLSEFKGKQNVLLVAWSTRCPVSAGEISSLEKLHAANKEKPLVVLGVNLDNLAATKLSEWAKSRKLTFRVLQDPKRTLLQPYDVIVTPTFFLIDKEGKVQARYENGGAPIREALAKDVEQLLRDGKVTPRSEPVRPTVYG